MDNEPVPFSTQFEDLIPFEGDEFRRAFDVVLRAMSDKFVVPEPGVILKEDEKGNLREYPIDVGAAALLSATDAMIWLYAPEPHKYVSLTARFCAFLKIPFDPDFARWCVKSDGALNVHHAVIEAAGTVRLTEEGYFPKNEMIKEIERIIREKYSDV